MTHAGRSNEQGVTLLELILVIVLMGILSAIIVVPVMTGAKAWNEMSRQKEVVQQARIGLERLVRELRAIQRVNGWPSIVTQWIEDGQPVAMGPTRIRITRAAPGNNEDDLEYSWAGPGQPLLRKSWLKGATPALDTYTSDVAAPDVQNFSLQYYEDSNAEHTEFRLEAEATVPAVVTCSGGGCAPTPDATASEGNLVVLNGGQPSIELKFSGTRIALIGPRANNLGIASVRIDKDPLPNPAGLPISFTVDQYAAAAASQQPLLILPLPGKEPLDYGDYLLTITPNGSNGASLGSAINVDAFELVISRVVVTLTVGEGACAIPENLCTSLRDQISFRRVE